MRYIVYNIRRNLCSPKDFPYEHELRSFFMKYYGTILADERALEAMVAEMNEFLKNMTTINPACHPYRLEEFGYGYKCYGGVRKGRELNFFIYISPLPVENVFNLSYFSGYVLRQDDCDEETPELLKQYQMRSYTSEQFDEMLHKLEKHYENTPYTISYTFEKMGGFERCKMKIISICCGVNEARSLSLSCSEIISFGYINSDGVFRMVPKGLFKHLEEGGSK